MPARRVAVARSQPSVSPRSAREVEITLDGARLRVREGEPIAVELWATGRTLLARSAKYHRPRGPYCFQGRCEGCLMRVDGVPNVMTCTVPVREGMSVESQNAFPSAGFDVFGVVDWFFPHGMDHHRMMTGNAALNRVMQSVARRMAGLGGLPAQTAEPVEVEVRTCDVLVIGAGVAGLAAATECARAGAEVVVLEEADHAGGQLAAWPAAVRRPDGSEVASGGELAETLVDDALRAGARIELGSSAVAAYTEKASPRRVRELLVARPAGLARWCPRRLIIATGAHDGYATFAGNDLPGVLSVRAAARLLARGVLAGERVVVAGDGAWPGAVADALRAAGASVERVPAEALDEAIGRTMLRRVRTTDARRIDCELLAVHAPPSPAFELGAQAGLPVRWEPEHGVFRLSVDEHAAGLADVWADAAGEVRLCRDLSEAMEQGRGAGRRAIGALAAARGAAGPGLERAT